MSLKSFLSEKLNQIDSAITNTSVVPGVNVARSIANKTTTDIDNKIVDKVTEYTNPKAIAKGGNFMAKAIANGFATFGASAGDIVGRGAVYGVGKATGNEELAQRATTQRTGTRELPGPIGKWVGPITPYADQYMNRRDEGQSVAEAGAKTIGAAALDNPFGTELKVLGMGGTLAFKGGKEALEPVIKKIATSKSAANITKWLGDVFKGGEKAEIDTLAKQLVTADTPELVTKTLDDAVQASEKVAEDTTKTSRFAERVAESDKVDPFMADELNKISYNVVKNKDTIKKADEFLAGKTLDESLAEFRKAYQVSDEGKVVVDNMTPEMNVVGIKLIDKLQEAGKTDELFDVIEQVSKSATSKGQAVQALALFSRVSPEGVINYASKRLSKSGLSPDDIKKAMTPEFIDELSSMAKANKKIEAGTYQRSVADALLLKKVDDLVPSTLGSKLATAQTISLLLNPKTITRNIIGNAGLNAAEGVAHNLFSTPMDMLTSMFTGKRTKVFDSPAEWGKGFVKGGKEGVTEAALKIDTKKLDTAYDFKSGVFKDGVADKLERALGVVLKGPDRAFYQATYDSSLANQLRAFAKTNKIKATDMDDLLSKIPLKKLDSMKEAAHYDGLYRTFQDPSKLADALQMVKSGLNKIGTPDGRFGMGDVIIKFPRTPANLINRGLAYSPAGFLKTVVEAGKPLFGKGFNQKAFVESFGRAMTGSTGLVGTGFALHELGILEGASPESKEQGKVERTTGLGQYKINASALKRFILSGFNPEAAQKQKGDALYSYDWFQPLAIGVSIGANMSESSKSGNVEDSIYNVLGMIQSGVDTTGEQPLFKNITDLFSGYGKPSEKIMKAVSDVPQTFIPTFVKQIRDLVDENQRETYDPSLFNQTFNTIKNKIPVVSSTLPPKVDIMGKDAETYQDGSNNVFNVMFNPGFVSNYKPTDEAKMVIDLYNETGSAAALPNSIQRSVMVNGESKKLSANEYYNMQKLTGVLSQRALYKMSQDPDFRKLPADKQAKIIGNTLTDIGSAAKVLLLGSKPKELDEGTIKVLNYYMNNKEDFKKILIPPSVNK